MAERIYIGEDIWQSELDDGDTLYDIAFDEEKYAAILADAREAGVGTRQFEFTPLRQPVLVVMIL